MHHPVTVCCCCGVDGPRAPDRCAVSGHARLQAPYVGCALFQEAANLLRHVDTHENLLLELDDLNSVLWRPPPTLMIFAMHAVGKAISL